MAVSRIAKITRPILAEVYPRKRLFEVLDNLRKQPVTWIAGPPGCGKTTLVSSYLYDRKIPCLWYQVDAGDADPATFFYYLGLAAKRAAPRKRDPLPFFTPEYLQGLPTFTLRYFEKLYARLKIPSVVVFDNYQEVPEASPFHEVILNGLSQIPEGVNVVLISRRDPPPVLTRLYANHVMKILGWNELRLTIEETIGIVRLRIKLKGSGGWIQHLHRTTDGWAAGLVLMVESAKRGAIDPQMIKKPTPEEIFKYFGTELFDKTDRETQDFFLKTSFLPKTTARMAEELTGLPSAGSTLSALSRDNYFTVKSFHTEPLYQFHPLFRDFLLEKAKKTYPAETLSNLLRRTAELLEDDGQIEAAISLLREAGNWDGMARLITKQAPLMVEQGRNRPLEEWMSSFPGDIMENNPWLLYWKGVCLVPVSPSVGRPFLEKALAKFKDQKDASGFFLAWSEVVLSIYYEFEDFAPLDRWIRLLDESMPEFREFPDKEIGVRVASAMVIALTNRQPWNPKIEEWAERALSFARESSNIHEQMNAISQVIVYRIFIRDFKKALTAIDLLRQRQHSRNTAPLTILNAKLSEVIYHRYSGRHEKCMQSLSEAMELSREEGIHVWDNTFLNMGISSALNVGDSKTARELLTRLEPSLSDPKPWKSLRYYLSKAREALSRGNSEEASLNADLALKLVTDVGTPLTLFFCHLVKTHAAHELGKQKESKNHLARASRLAYRMKSNLLKFLVLLTKALYALDDGRPESGLRFLRGALMIGREEGYFDTYMDQPFVVSRLCIKALEAGIEVEYVQELIRRLNIMPEKPPLHLENWPWPLKIFTLGRFELFKDGQPIRFSKKVQQKPLAMLKALVALGGKGVGEGQITDAVWPEADGDVAHQSFSTNLHRLRQVLAYEKAIQRQEGRLTLDNKYCWVDTWAFEYFLERADAQWKAGKTDSAVELMEKAIGFYKGSFLGQEIEQPWTMTMSERLRSMFLRSVRKLGIHWQQSGQWEKTLECFQKGLEVDKLAEEFYQGVMTCYQELGRRGEALAVYNRCKKMLSTVLGVEPSPKTEAIHKSLMGNSGVPSSRDK